MLPDCGRLPVAGQLPAAEPAPALDSDAGQLAIVIADPLRVRPLSSQPLAAKRPASDDHPLPSSVVRQMWSNSAASIKAMSEHFTKINIYLGMQNGPDLPTMPRFARYATPSELKFSTAFHQHLEKAYNGCVLKCVGTCGKCLSMTWSCASSL